RILLLLFHQRACAALPGHALSARLQPPALVRILSRAVDLALSVDAVPARGPAARLAQSPSFLFRPALRRHQHHSVSRSAADGLRILRARRTTALSRPYQPASRHLRGIHPALLRHFDESGVLHFSDLSSAADADRRRLVG